MKKIEFKMLNPKVAEIVEKLGLKAPKAPELKDEELQKLNMAIDKTIGDIKTELRTTEKALAEVISVVKGEISRRGIAFKVENQISMFNFDKQIESK